MVMKQVWESPYTHFASSECIHVTIFASLSLQFNSERVILKNLLLHEIEYEKIIMRKGNFSLPNSDKDEIIPVWKVRQEG